MKFNEKEVVLKDKTICILRSPDECDAEKMIEYLKTTSEETYFMLRYPEEINITVNKEIEILKEILKSPKDIMIAAFVNNELAGNAGIYCARDQIKLRHRAMFGISIKEKYWNNGIGSLLIKEVIEIARQMGYEQIELGVFSDNKKAISLYEKYGFEIWGRVKNAYKLKDETYRDEINMGRIL